MAPTGKDRTEPLLEMTPTYRARRVAVVVARDHSHAVGIREQRRENFRRLEFPRWRVAVRSPLTKMWSGSSERTVALHDFAQANRSNRNFCSTSHDQPGVRPAARLFTTLSGCADVTPDVDRLRRMIRNRATSALALSEVPAKPPHQDIVRRVRADGDA